MSGTRDATPHRMAGDHDIGRRNEPRVTLPLSTLGHLQDAHHAVDVAADAAHKSIDDVFANITDHVKSLEATIVHLRAMLRARDVELAQLRRVPSELAEALRVL